MGPVCVQLMECDNGVLQWSRLFANRAGEFTPHSGVVQA